LSEAEKEEREEHAIAEHSRAEQGTDRKSE